MSEPIYTPQALYAPDVMSAVHGFILAWAVPALPSDCIIRGWENRYALPAKSNDYAVYSMVGETRRGTNVSTISDDTLVKTKLVTGLVQVDFCSDTDAARLRASALELAARDEYGVNYFKEHGISALYADDPKDLSYVNGGEQYIKRFMVQLHLCWSVGLSAAAQSFNIATMSRVENVDVHHPVKGD